MEEVARLCSRLVVLSGGTLALEGPPGEVFRRGQELRAMGLDVPATVQVLEALRGQGWALPEVALDVETAADAIASALAGRGGAAPC
jgi:ABC-type multidrug transport system ATPase subunit